MQIGFKSNGSFDKTDAWLKKLEKGDFFNALDSAGKQGVAALSSVTPVETSETAHSWDYEVTHESGRHQITWTNSHVEKGVNVAIILQYGHGTGTGGYVAGRDYINPAIRPIFDQLELDVWKAVTEA